MARFLAVMIVYVIPGAIAVFGFKMMRDTVFLYFDPTIHHFMAGRFFAALAMFLFGLCFIAGYILHKDRKKNRVQSRFQKKI
nr:DUF2627 domain-containing protein [Aneurinibacillus terranovensis]